MRDETEDLVLAGYRLARMADTPTHAMCTLFSCPRRGRVVPADADDHSCRWAWLVRVESVKA